jgi:DNA-binding transcriptional LysR family regulator
MNMNLDYLKTFIEVIKLGSFSEVAKRFSLSQPAISFQIQKLEQDLGVRLIDRRQKNLTLTEAGQRLLAFAKAVDSEYLAMINDIEHLKEGISGNLTIAASTIPGDFILPPLLSEFKKLHPMVNVQVMITDSARVIEAIKDGTYQIGFCGKEPVNSGIEAFKIGEDEIVLIVFPEHPFANRKDVSFQEITGEPFIFREETSGTQKSVQSLLLSKGLDIGLCKPTLILGTTEAVVSAVESRSGIAFVSNLAIKKSIALELVKTVLIQETDLKRDFWCIYRRQVLTSRLNEEFLAFIRERPHLY